MPDLPLRNARIVMSLLAVFKHPALVPAAAPLPAIAVDQASVTQDCFNAVLQLTQPLAPAGFVPLYAHLRERLDGLLARPSAIGLSEADAHDIAYAVVALADEIALKASPELAQFWLPRRLQLIYFNDNMAGEGFFQRLDALRHEPRRHRVLQAYYIALALGFEGRYGRRGGVDEIELLMAAVHQTLLAHTAEVGGGLSKHGEPHDGPQAKLRWYLATPAFAGLLAAACALFYGALWLNLQQASQAVVGRAESLFVRLGS